MSRMILRAQPAPPVNDERARPPRAGSRTTGGHALSSRNVVVASRNSERRPARRRQLQSSRSLAISQPAVATGEQAEQRSGLHRPTIGRRRPGALDADDVKSGNAHEQQLILLSGIARRPSRRRSAGRPTRRRPSCDSGSGIRRRSSSSKDTGTASRSPAAQCGNSDRAWSRSRWRCAGCSRADRRTSGPETLSPSQLRRASQPR